MKEDLPKGLSQPARRALHGAGYFTLAQVVAAEHNELLNLHGLGPKGMRILKDALQDQGYKSVE